MSKINFKPGNMIYPLPAVMVSCGDIETESNILTVAWTGTICTNPPMAYISVRPERYSYDMIKKSGEFVINLTTEQLIKATDFCGVRSGRDVDKWLKCNLTKEKADTVKCPLIAESPVNIECKVTEIKELGSHHMFIADVTAVHVDESYMDKNNSFHLNNSNLLAYSHGSYFGLGNELGTFGYSIRKKKAAAKSSQKAEKKSRGKPPWLILFLPDPPVLSQKVLLPDPLNPSVHLSDYHLLLQKLLSGRISSLSS